MKLDNFRAIPFLCMLAMCAVLAPTAAKAATVERLSIYSDNESDDTRILKALVTAFKKMNPKIQVTFTSAPDGISAPTAVQDKLVAGKMEDVFSYYSGSLLQSVNPARYLTDLSHEPWRSTLVSSFIPAVSTGPIIYGAPIGSAGAGGIFYNKVVYKQLNLTIPRNWNHFILNNKIIKKAGIIPVAQTYGDPWTAQILILADAYNLLAASPNFPQLLTAGRVTIASTPSAVAGFQHLADLNRAGLLNRDYKTANFDEGLAYVATGNAAHYPMLTFAAATIVEKYPDLADDVGLFPVPGPSTVRNGLTVWMPDALYIPKNSKNIANAKKFLAFATSAAGLAVIAKAIPPTGPYMISNAKLPSNVAGIVKEMQTYFNATGRTAPALEFLSPVKGPHLPAIAVLVGSGEMSAIEGAAAYDIDVREESQRLGLPGWGKLN